MKLVGKVAEEPDDLDREPGVKVVLRAVLGRLEVTPRVEEVKGQAGRPPDLRVAEVPVGREADELPTVELREDEVEVILLVFLTSNRGHTVGDVGRMVDVNALREMAVGLLEFLFASGQRHVLTVLPGIFIFD